MWLGSIARPTGVEWRSQFRCTSVKVRLRSSSRCWTMRRSWHQKVWNNHSTTCVGRILARHTHAMLLGVFTFVTENLEPGMRASGPNLWLLEVLAACVLCFDGAWITRGDWNMEPHEHTVKGKIGYVRRRSGVGPRLRRCVPGDGSSGATG